MEKFEYEGRKYWEGFGKNIELLPRQYFDFVDAEKYREVLGKYDLQKKKVVDIGAGYPAPKEFLGKKSSPLSSELQEIIETRGAKIIAVDVAKAPLERQKKIDRESILGNAFQLPFKDESIDGGVTILNLLNSSFKGRDDREVFVNPEECKNILQEIYRILQKNKFAVINNYGYIIATVDNFIKITGPDENEIITPEIIKELAREVGFQNVEDIPLDEKRFELAKKFASESFPENLRDRILVEIKGSGALLIEK